MTQVTIDRETAEALAKFRALTPNRQDDLLAAMEWLTHSTGANPELTARAIGLWDRLTPEARQTMEGIAAQVIERGA